MRRILVLPRQELRTMLFAPEVEQRLRDLGEVVMNPQPRELSSDELRTLISGFEAVITSWGSPKFTTEVMEVADSLRIISHAAGSFKHLVSQKVFEKGVTVCTAQPAMAISVAAMNVAMMEILLRNVVNYASQIRLQKKWRPEGVSGHRELNGKVVGIVGASLIGRETIRYLEPFDVSILLFDPYITEEQAAGLGAKKVSLEELFAQSDVISINAPLTEETRGMIQREHLQLIKEGAVLTNCARGAVFDHDALVEELKTERFSAWLDVTDPEPLPEGHELFGLPNVVCTPHISGGTPEMIHRQGEAAVHNLELFFAGKTPDRVLTAQMLEHTA